jgi:hypothetical protein
MSKQQTNTQWKPILTVELAARAQDAIAAIIDDITKLDVETQRPFELCECALLFTYLSISPPQAGWRERALTYLNFAIEKVSVLPYQSYSLGLYGGMAGVGWIIEHVSKLLEESEPILDVPPEQLAEELEDDPVAQIDELIIRHLKSGPWQGHYDLIGGLTGFGTYFLERLPHSSSTHGIQFVLTQLEQLAEPATPGATWFTRPELLIGPQLKESPKGHYNLGVAHGVPGVIQFLGETLAHGIEKERTGKLLEASVEWVLAQQRPPEAIFRFSTGVIPGQEQRGSRLGWCYGDLGIAAVLYQTGNRTGRKDWREMSIELLQHTLCVPRDKACVTDAGLCHGATGVAHILNRISQAEGGEQYENAAISWFEQALAMRQDGRGIGGFLAHRPELDPPWRRDASFLTGGIGIALTLLSAIYPIEPQWDRLLLLSGQAGILTRD